MASNNQSQLQADLNRMRRGLNTKGSNKNSLGPTSGGSGGKIVLSYQEIMEIVKKSIGNQLIEEINPLDNNKKVVKDKQYLRDRIKDVSETCRVIIESQRIALRKTSTEELVAMLANDIVGYSALADAFYDDEVTDIFCMSYNKIYVEKKGKNVKYEHNFDSPEAYKIFVERLLREAEGKELNRGENKIVDFDLYGDRYNVINDIVSPAGITMTIRKHSESHLQLKQMIEWKLMSPEFADLFGMLLAGESNLVYAGVTGSGKTTTLRALLDYYVSRINKRILVCEDTRELFLENDHTVELVTVKGSKGADKDATSITLNDLIISALRMKPKYIVVGEVRGVEAETAVEAMATGHSTVFSMHAGTPIDVVNRLITKYLQAMPSLGVDVVERIIGSSLEFIAIQDDIPGIGRRCTSLTEVNFNYETGRVVMNPIVKFNFKTQGFDYLNPVSEGRIEKLRRRGITQAQLDKYMYSLFDKKDEEKHDDENDDSKKPIKKEVNHVEHKKVKQHHKYEDYDDEDIEDDEI